MAYNINNHLQLYPHRPDLTIASQAAHYADSKRGRGPTHVDAYKAGARFVLRLLKEGLISLDDC